MTIENQSDFLLNTFGITAPADPTPPAEPPADPPAPPANDPPADPPSDPPADPPADPKPVDTTKAEAAFAAMRVENSTYKKSIEGMAKILGIDSKDPDALAKAVQDRILEAQSKKDNIPVETLKRLDDLDADRETRERERIRDGARKGFADTAARFKLDDSGVEEFAKSLKASGINPYEMEVDIPSLYILQNFDKLYEKAIAEGMSKEAARAEAASHASTPNNHTGKAPGTPGSINTVKALDNFMSTL